MSNEMKFPEYNTVFEDGEQVICNESFKGYGLKKIIQKGDTLFLNRSKDRVGFKYYDDSFGFIKGWEARRYFSKIKN